MILSRSTKSTHRSSTICPLVNNSSSCGGNHPSLIPSSLIFPRIFCRKRKDNLFSRKILRGRCDHSMVGPSPAIHSCTSTIIMFKVILKYSEGLMYEYGIASLVLCEIIQPTTQPKQTNPQSNPNTTPLRIIIIVIIYIGQNKK